jgi:hypothetical protein
LKKEKEKKPNHKSKQFFSNGIRLKIGLFERKKKAIIIWNDFEKNKRSMLLFEDSLTSIDK